MTANSDNRTENTSSNEQQQQEPPKSSDNIIIHTWHQTSNHTKSKCLYFVSALLFAIFLALFLAQTIGFPKSNIRPRESVVVFTDGDVDDYLALHMLFKRSDVSVPLVVVSGNGISSPQAAFKNIQRYVQFLQKQQISLPSSENNKRRTRVVLGTTLSNRDFVKNSPPWRDEFTGRCSYHRFARTSLPVTVAADSLYGCSDLLKNYAKMSSSSSENGNNNNNNNGNRIMEDEDNVVVKTNSSSSFISAFAAVANGALQQGNKLTLISLAPLSDVALLLDAISNYDYNLVRDMRRRAASQNGNSDEILPLSQIPTITSSLKLILIQGGKLDLNSNSVPDSLMMTRDIAATTSAASSSSSSTTRNFGSMSELNFFLDPEGADKVLGFSHNSEVEAANEQSSSSSSSSSSNSNSNNEYWFGVPTLLIPLDISGSSAAYIDYNDQWLRLTAESRLADPVQLFLAKLLKEMKSYEGQMLFPFKGTPKSVATVSIFLDRSVRNKLFSKKSKIGVFDYDDCEESYATACSQMLRYIGRSGTSSESDDGFVEFVAGFSAKFSSSTTSTSRIFLDSYLTSTSLPWV